MSSPVSGFRQSRHTDMRGYKVPDARMELGDGGWPGDTIVRGRESGPFPEHAIASTGKVTRGKLLKMFRPSA